MTSHPQDLLDTIQKIKKENDEFIQSILNIENKKRTSIFPWKGQFSPQLIEYILEENTSSESCILDPFCGSGTTLYESARKGVYCFGADINPAAYIFSSIIVFCNLDLSVREKIIKEVIYISETNISSIEKTDLFNSEGLNFETELLNFYEKCSDCYYKKLIATVLLMLSMGQEAIAKKKTFFKSLNTVLKTIQMLPFSKFQYTPFLADARQLNKITSKSVDLVITSPPYINVFNYHQNYRKALEMIGWEPLKIAKSEIGANRKHRSNRFLTVIQYCMDMSEVFLEMRRVLNDNGKIVIVVGRESSVRGINFKNGILLAMVASGSIGLEVIKWQERAFINRYGEKIYEDIFTFKISNSISKNYLEISRSIGTFALKNSLTNAEDDVKKDLESAIKESSQVKLSPKLDIKEPTLWHLSTVHVKNTVVI